MAANTFDPGTPVLKVAQIIRAEFWHDEPIVMLTCIQALFPHRSRRKGRAKRIGQHGFYGLSAGFCHVDKGQQFLLPDHRTHSLLVYSAKVNLLVVMLPST